MEIREPVRSMQILPATENAALSSMGFVVMAGAVVAAEMLIAGEELVYRVASGLSWR